MVNLFELYDDAQTCQRQTYNILLYTFQTSLDIYMKKQVYILQPTPMTMYFNISVPINITLPLSPIFF
jgi:hypothetical protein